MVLNRQISRKIKRNFFRYAGVFVLLVVGIAIVTGYNCAAVSVLEKLNDSKASYNVEDGDFQTSVVVGAKQKRYIENMGFNLEEQFYYDYEDDGSTLRIFPVRKEINKLEKTTGSADISGNEIFFDRKYGENRDYKIGETVKVADREYIVKGMGCVPDYILIISDLTSNSSDPDKFGLAFMGPRAFNRLPADKIVYNYAFKGDKNWSEKEREDKISELRDYLKAERLMVGFLENSESTRVTGIFTKLESDHSTALALGIVVMLILSFLLFAITKADIARERKSIGALYAQGYRPAEILRCYIKLPLILTVAGSVVGYGIGSHLLMKPLVSSAYSFYCIPEVDLVQKAGPMAAAVLLPFFIVLLINTVGLMRLLNAQPLVLLKNDRKKERVFGLRMGHFPFLTRFRLRILIKCVADNLLLVVGLILSCFLLIMGMGMKDSIRVYIEDVKQDVPSNYVYMLNSHAKTDDKGAEKLKIAQFKYDFKQAEENMTITCYGIRADSAYIDCDTEGKKGIVLSSAVSEKFGLKKGDTIRLTDMEGDNTYQLKVSGVKDYSAGLYAFMDMGQLNRVLGEKEKDYNGYFSDHELDLKEADISSVLTRDDIVESAEQYYEMTAATIQMMTMAAIVIAVILMFVIFGMGIDKNKYSISLGKILGYSDRELGSVFIDGKLFVVALGIVIGIPLDLYLMKQMWPSLILTFRGFIPFTLSWGDIFKIGVIQLAAYLAVRVITAVSLNRVELTYVLKERE